MLAAIGAAGLGASGLLLPGGQALAQKPWPERPINYRAVPTGRPDGRGRAPVGKALGDAERWNVVENKPAAPHRRIGAARRRPGWRSRCRTRPTPRSSPAAPATMIRDLTPLAGLASSPIMVVVNAKSNIRSMEDLARAAAPNSCRRAPAAMARRRT